MTRLLLYIAVISVIALTDQADAISCHHCNHKKTIPECFKKGQIKECSSKDKACFYQESQPYYRYGQWTVSMGCGKSYMRAGCDERMGTLKCIRWCQSSDNCNKLIAQRPKKLIAQSRATKEQEMGQYIAVIILYTSVFLAFEVITFDSILLCLTYGANLVETKF